MESQSSEDDFVVLSLLKKRKGNSKYWVHPILALRRTEGEMHLRINEPQDYRVIQSLLKGTDPCF